tara:strand:+ start:604 stop:1029 length:426 start_codon:yes stop_codon:yes gene_type:complete
MAKELSDAEYRKRFRKELIRLDKTLSPEEQEEMRNVSFPKRLLMDAPRDVIGPKIKRQGLLSAIPGMGERDLSPEDRAKEIFEAGKKRRVKEKKTTEAKRKNRARAKANPSLLKGGVNYKKGGKVRGAGIARKGVRPAKMR